MDSSNRKKLALEASGYNPTVKESIIKTWFHNIHHTFYIPNFDNSFYYIFIILYSEITQSIDLNGPCDYKFLEKSWSPHKLFIYWRLNVMLAIIVSNKFFYWLFGQMIYTFNDILACCLLSLKPLKDEIKNCFR
jgi:hypothetical protein